MKRSVLLLLVTACSSDYFAFDDFSYSDGDWYLEEKTGDPVVRLTEDIAYDGPALCGEDHGFSGSTEFWRFSAPKRYLGNASSAYGKRLTWDSQTDKIGRQFKANDLFMGGRGILLVARVSNPPGRVTSWASFSVWLDEKTEWRWHDDGRLATAEDIKAALGSLNTLRLPGEWRDGAETTCIDNIYFGTP